MSGTTSITFWLLFHVLIAAAIYVDLVLLNRDNTNNNMKLNLFTVAMWIAAGLGFGFVVWEYKGLPNAMNYWTGYMLEQSLSVDNLFVFLLIFQYFAVSPLISVEPWCGVFWQRSFLEVYSFSPV